MAPIFEMSLGGRALENTESPRLHQVGVRLGEQTQYEAIMMFIKRNTTGFTLIELLVVMAIVSLLLGILIPALRGARQAAFQVACGANERSVAYGLIMYAESFDD